MVDTTSNFVLYYPLRAKDSSSVAEQFLDLVPVFIVLLFIRSDPETEFTAEVVQHLFRWLKVSIDN